jgi:hypothetical protein
LKEKAAMKKTDLAQLTNEWRCGVLLNPFRLIDDSVSELCSDKSWRSDKRKKNSGDVCMDMAEIFLECTSYRVTEIEILRDGEKYLMAASLHYLYNEAPADEQNLPMVCGLVRADIASDYAVETDLQRLLNMLAEKYETLDYFEAYMNNPAGRGRIVKSLMRRLSPLCSFYSDENVNIFESCGTGEIFDMGVALLHNLGEIHAKPHGLESNADEIAFIVAALHLIHNAYATNEQVAKSLFYLL